MSTHPTGLRWLTSSRTRGFSRPTDRPTTTGPPLSVDELVSNDRTVPHSIWNAAAGGRGAALCCRPGSCSTRFEQPTMRQVSTPADLPLQAINNDCCILYWVISAHERKDSFMSAGAVSCPEAMRCVALRLFFVVHYVDCC